MTEHTDFRADFKYRKPLDGKRGDEILDYAGKALARWDSERKAIQLLFRYAPLALRAAAIESLKARHPRWELVEW